MVDFCKRILEIINRLLKQVPSQVIGLLDELLFKDDMVIDDGVVAFLVPLDPLCALYGDTEVNVDHIIEVV